MNLYNNNPNFSIVMPGGCNANCEFCFNDANVPEKMDVAYLSRLMLIFDRIEPEFRQISITGGEPLLSPVFHDVMKMIKNRKRRFPKVVLTTNGTFAKELGIAIAINGAVDHINISRHHFDQIENKKIFGGSYDVSDNDLLEIIDGYGKIGIDVSVNCVINNNTDSGFTEQFISWSRSMGFNAVHFRQENGNLKPTDTERYYADKYNILSFGTCPVCRSAEQRIKGIPVVWKSSVMEPSDVMEQIYEVIYQPDGKLYADWSKKQLVDIAYMNPFAAAESPADRGIYQSNDHDGQQSCGSSGCGRPSSSRGCGSSGC